MRLAARLLAATAIVAAGFVAPVRADPISGAIAAIGAAGSIGGAVLGAGSVGAFLLNGAIGIGVSLGLSALSSALQTKPKAGEALSGLETSVQIGGDVARQICIGNTLAKGQLVYHNTNGADNQFYQRVFVLSDWRHETLAAVWINGQRYTLTELGRDDLHVNFTVDGTARYVNVDLWFGRQGAGQADGFLVASANPAGKWSANSTLTGLCYVSVNFTYYKDAPYYQNGVPDLGFELGPACLYDWRQDSTSGGSGDQRWDDPATWRPSDNPVVATYNYLRGFHLGGELILGMAVPSYDFVLETWTAAANVCDESVTKDDGTTEPRYRCSAILTADEDVPHSKALDALLATFAGYLYDYGGSYVCQAGAAQYPVDPIGDDDLVIGAPVSFAAKRSRAELVNTIHGQFVDPASNWQPQSYAAQASPNGIINDGEELGRPLDLLNVASQAQAERIAKIRLRESRAQASAGITVGFHRLDVQVGDWLPWNSARFGTRIWRVTDKQVNASTRAVTLALAEIDAAVFSWTAADEGAQPAAPIRLQPGGRISTVSNFGAQAVGVQSGDGITEVPGLRFFWAPITDATVDAVVIEYRQLAVGSGAPGATTRVTDSTPDDGELLVTSGIVNATDYEYRATIRTTPARYTTWTPWVSMRTTETFAVAVTIDALVGELKDVIDHVPNNLDQLLADADARADAIRAEADDIHAALSDDPNLRSTSALHDLRTVRSDLDNLAAALASNTAAFAQLQGGLVEAGFQISSNEGRARISAVAVVGNQLRNLSITVDALSGKIDLYGSVQTGDLSGVVNAITAVQLSLDAVTGRIQALASQETVTGLGTRLSAAEQLLDGPNGLATTAVRNTEFDGLALRTTNVENTLDAIAGSATLDLTSIAAAAENVDSLSDAVAQLLGQILAGNATVVEQLATVRDAYSVNTSKVAESIASVTRDLVAVNDNAVAGLSRLDLAKVTADEATALARLQVQARFGAYTSNLDQILASYATTIDAGSIAQTKINVALQPGGAIAGVLAGYTTTTVLSQTLAGYVTPTSAQGIADTRISAQLGAGGSIAGALANYVSNVALSQTLSGYVTPGSAQGIADTQIRAYIDPGGPFRNYVDGTFTTDARVAQTLTAYVTPGSATGIIDNRIATQLGPGGSIGSTITSRLVSYSDSINSLAGQTSELYAHFNDISASNSMVLVSQAGPTGASTAVAFVLRAAATTTALRLLAMSDGTSVCEVAASSFRIVDPAFGSLPLFQVNAGAAEFYVPVRVKNKDLEQNATTNWKPISVGQTALANANQVLSGSELTLNTVYPGFVEMDIAFDIVATGAFYAYAEVDATGFSWPIVTMNTTPSNSDSNRRYVQGRITLEVGAGNHGYRIRVVANNATIYSGRGAVKITKT